MPTARSSADVMILDDQFLVRVALDAMLGDAGYACLDAESGDEALAGLRAMPCRVLIADVNLGPRGRTEDGREVAAEAMRRYPGLGVIYCGADELRLDRALGPRERSLRKPFSAEQLLPLVAELLAAELVPAD